MKNLSVNLKNFYGIKSLTAQFDFITCKANAIYAPNGAMKSSLAKTFQDIAESTLSKGRIFPGRECTRPIRTRRELTSTPRASSWSDLTTKWLANRCCPADHHNTMRKTDAKHQFKDRSFYRWRQPSLYGQDTRLRY